MHRTALPRRAATTLLASLAAAGAHAASFDCKMAKTPTEKAICGSPRLSALDEKLARDYERALHALSPAGATQLKASQRSWLRFATQVCVPRKKTPDGDPPASCLEAEFKRRLEQLAQAGVRLGPYVFNRVDFYSSASTPGEGGTYPDFVVQHAGFPQIDSPANAATAAWNAAMRLDDPGPVSGRDSPDDEIEDDDTDYTFGCADSRFVSVQVDRSEYQHGTAHGGYDHQVTNLLLAPAARKMAATDVFAAKAPWKTRLPALFWKAYIQDADANKDMPSIKEAIESVAVDPDRWLLTPDGLQVSFNAYEAGCYACNPGPITVAWIDLKPMLATPDLAACKAPPHAKP